MGSLYRGAALVCVATSLGVAAWGSVACSSSPDSSDGGDADTNTACGAGPYATISAHLVSLTTNQPVEGATITLDPSPCPSFSATTDTNGDVSVRVTTDAAVNPRIERSGYVTMRTGEQIYRGDFQASDPLLPTVVVGLLPHWAATAPDILVVVSTEGVDGGEGGACTSKSGVTVSVPGHPEAVVTYYQPGVDGGLPSPDNTLTATTESGVAEVSGLTGGATIQLAASSTTCPSISFVSYPHTGSYHLENGVLTAAAAFLSPHP